MLSKENLMSEQYRIETLAIHAGQEPDPSTGAIMTPIYQTSTYVLPEVGQNRGYEYSRSDNPTRTALQANLAALEGAKYGLAFASGLAATDIVMRLMRPGDHIVVGDDVYGGTYRMFDKVLKHYGLNFSFVDLTDLDAFQQALRAETKLVWLETPTNPNLKLADIAALSELAHARQALVVVDNTFASSYLQNPLALGADLVLHSTTKYLGGHSDVVGGAVMLNDQAIYEQLKFLQNAIGSVPAPNARRARRSKAIDIASSPRSSLSGTGPERAFASRLMSVAPFGSVSPAAVAAIASD